jgi:hypothetical protein
MFVAQEQWLLRSIAISRASIWSFLVIIVATVSSTLGTDTAFFRSATPIGIEDCRLDQITVFLARGIETVMIALASNHTVPLPEALIYLNNISCMPRLEK